MMLNCHALTSATNAASTECGFRAVPAGQRRAMATPLGGVVDRLGRRLWAAAIAWHGRRATIRALARLDDRALKDIGLHRCEIRAAAVDGRPRHNRSLGNSATNGISHAA